MTTSTATQKTAASPQPDTLAVLSIVFGVVSLTGPGLFLGIPAIILAGIALKKNVPGHGLSVAGLVTGIISTILSLLFIAFMAFVFYVAVQNSNAFYDNYYPAEESMPAHHDPQP
jgi:hypothetical protein